jgi:hypothetical protein
MLKLELIEEEDGLDELQYPERYKNFETNKVGPVDKLSDKCSKTYTSTG